MVTFTRHVSPSTINASEGLGEILTYTNSVTNNWLSTMIILGVYVLILIGYYKARDDFKGAMAVAGYGAFVLSLLFWVGGFVSGWTFAITIGLAILGTFILLMDND